MPGKRFHGIEENELRRLKETRGLGMKPFQNMVTDKKGRNAMQR